MLTISREFKFKGAVVFTAKLDLDAEWNTATKSNEIIMRLNGNRLPRESVLTLMVDSLRSIQDSFARPKEEAVTPAIAKAYAEKRAQRIIDGVNTRVDEVTVEARQNALKAWLNPKSAEYDARKKEWEGLKPGERTAKLDAILAKYPEMVEAAQRTVAERNAVVGVEISL